MNLNNSFGLTTKVENAYEKYLKLKLGVMQSRPNKIGNLTLEEQELLSKIVKKHKKDKLKLQKIMAKTQNKIEANKIEKK